MRFERVDLIRFGKFTGARLEVSDAQPDFHIVVGRNEAGKTTAMAAIEDLLFGIPARTPYAFLHGYDELRVGGVVATGGERLSIRRRKGNRDTLLDETEAAFAEGEATLQRFLGAVDREFFLRMFGLSHHRLAEGGSEIAAAEGEVGEMLFAAGAALRGLRVCRKGLDSEAAALWAPRKSKTRRFYQASARFTEVDRALRQGTKRPEEWKRLRRDRDAAAGGLRELEDDYRVAAAESRRCHRVRRLLPSVRRLAELEEAIGSLAHVALLPEDAAARVDASRGKAADAGAEIRVHEQALETKRRAREAVQPDPQFRERQSALEEVETMRLKVEPMRSDLPKRNAERDVHLGTVRQAARDLGWAFGADDSLLERIPSDRHLADLNDLLQRRGALAEAVRAAGTALSEAERRLDEHRSRLSADRRPEAAARLDAVVGANPTAGDLEARARDVRRERDELREQIAGLRAGLSPALPDDIASEAALRSLPVPTAEEIDRSRDRFRDLEEKLEGVHRRTADVRRQLRADEDRRGELERAAPGVTRSSLDEVRSDRDTAWDAVRARFLDPATDGDREALATQFEDLVREADGVADRRFESAEAAGRLAATELSIREREVALRAFVAEKEELVVDRQGLLAEWRSHWEACPFEPLLPDRMAAWEETRGALVSAYQSLGRKQRELAALETEERTIRDQLSAALLPFGVSAEELEADPLRMILRRAETAIRDEREADQREKDVRAELAKAGEERNREQSRLERARADTAAWKSEWERSLAEAGLDPVPPGDARASLLTDMRVSANTVRELQHRIARMEEDIRRFEEMVRGLASELVPELNDLPAAETAIRLRDRLRGDLDRRREQEELDQEIRELQEAIRQGRATVARSEAELAPLHELAGTTDQNALWTAIEESDRKRALAHERAGLRDQLATDADGLSLADVRAECEGVGPDEAKVREEAAASRLEEITAERNRLAERLGESRKELEAFADDDAAAQLAAERQGALAAVREAAERYARVRTAETLLRWALDRFRKEKQGPMLRRAGDLFRTLTGGSFASLEVGVDAKDRLRLEAIRADGQKVQVSGLSSGSEDQLYLALRIAAIEDYVKRAPALPFLADDLFVNFDEERAGAGFRILGDLADSAQVLFFTHHEHLVAIARDVLGNGVPVIRLEEV